MNISAIKLECKFGQAFAFGQRKREERCGDRHVQLQVGTPDSGVCATFYNIKTHANAQLHNITLHMQLHTARLQNRHKLSCGKSTNVFKNGSDNCKRISMHIWTRAIYCYQLRVHKLFDTQLGIWRSRMRRVQLFILVHIQSSSK